MAITVNSCVRYKECIAAIVEPQSHTGDTSETTVGTIVVGANTMGPYGYIAIHASFVANGGGVGNRTLRIYFGGTKIIQYTGSSATLQLDSAPVHVWNRGATNDQETRSMNAVYTHARAGDSRTTMAKDTTADVNVDFKIQNSAAGLSSCLRFAYVEMFRFDHNE